MSFFYTNTTILVIYEFVNKNETELPYVVIKKTPLRTSGAKTVLSFINYPFRLPLPPASDMIRCS